MDGKKQVVAWESHILRQCEQKWSITELECLAFLTLTVVKDNYVYMKG